MEDVQQQCSKCTSAEKTVDKSVWVWTVQQAIRLLHTEWNPLKGQLYPPDISILKQPNLRSLDQGCEKKLSHPSTCALNWSCSLQVQVLQHHRFSKKALDGEGEINIKFILAAPETHFNEGTQPAMHWLKDTLHHTQASLQYLDLRKSWQCTELMPNFCQHVKCPTRGNNILDHAYTNTKHAHRVTQHPHLGQSDHLSLLLTPAYTPLRRSTISLVKTITIWPEDALLQL